jgi:hypothetical protein
MARVPTAGEAGTGEGEQGTEAHPNAADHPLEEVFGGADAHVDEDHEIHTDLDSKVYGPDDVWNQLMYTGQSPADLLVMACDVEDLKAAMAEYGTAGQIPVWWDTVSKDVSSKTGAARRDALRKKCWAVITKKAKQLFDLGRGVEPEVTKAMTDVGADCGGKLVGLEWRLKTLASTQRKLLFETCSNPQMTVIEVMRARMTDALRYTVQFPTADYVRLSLSLIDALQTEYKYTKAAVRNYWETGHAYDGLNTAFRKVEGVRKSTVKNLGGVMFEVQIHTPQSFHAKEEDSHTLYEYWRVVDDVHVGAVVACSSVKRSINTVPRLLQRKYAIFSLMVEKFNGIPRPPSDSTSGLKLLDIGTLHRKGMAEPEGYQTYLQERGNDEILLLRKGEFDFLEVAEDVMNGTSTVNTEASDRIYSSGKKLSRLITEDVPNTVVVVKDDKTENAQDDDDSQKASSCCMCFASFGCFGADTSKEETTPKKMANPIFGNDDADDAVRMVNPLESGAVAVHTKGTFAEHRAKVQVEREREKVFADTPLSTE